MEGGWLLSRTKAESGIADEAMDEDGRAPGQGIQCPPKAESASTAKTYTGKGCVVSVVT